MNLPRIAAPTLGAIAILANTATLTFTISFAGALQRQDSQLAAPAIAASALGGLGLASVVLLVYRQIRYRNRWQEGQLRGWWWRRLSEAAGILCLLSAAVTLATYIWMEIRRMDLPAHALGVSTRSLLTAAFILWGVSTLAHVIFLFTIALLDRRATQKSRPTTVQETTIMSSEMREPSPQTAPRTSDGKESTTDDSRTSTWSSRKRSGSDTMASLRSSITHVVRPISSKTRLITQSQKYRPTSLDSGTGEREIVEDGFDSWDTSAVDPQSRQTVMNSSATGSTNPSPVPPRFLETIPASPTGSRSPSPGFPLDLEPPPFAHRRRSRSHSPATSFRNVPLRDRAASPSSLHGSEAHIHPLFRSDSPTPPPSATPGTIVTAAPNAGHVIPLSERRSLHRMRSGSLPTSPSPLVHSNSMDDISRTASRTRSPYTASPNPLSPVEMSDEEEESTEENESPPEREMTPPIPEWILGAGQRSSLSGYARRKTGGLGAVGEEGG